MSEHTRVPDEDRDERPAARPPAGKAPWQPPKLTFVEPTLVRQGDLQEVTGQGFFGTFIT
jgi:hypothetical protein